MLRIAVDFDGTIVEHAYPEIGKEKLFAFYTLRELQKRGMLLILWTFRSGKELDEAVDFCRKNGVEFYAVNKNHPEEVFEPENQSRKIDADIYIDDKNLGGFPGWSEAWQMIDLDGIYHSSDQIEKQLIKKNKKSLFQKLFGEKQ
jgi:hypothetical protein